MNSTIRKFVDRAASRMGTRSLMIGMVALVAGFPALAQDSAVQERLAIVKQAMATNAQKLHQTILNATAKQLVVTTTHSNYQRLGGT